MAGMPGPVNAQRTVGFNAFCLALRVLCCTMVSTQQTLPAEVAVAVLEVPSAGRRPAPSRATPKTQRLIWASMQRSVFLVRVAG